MLSKLCVIILSIFSTFITTSKSVFNEEISARVDDFLTNYLDLVSRSLYGPYNTLVTGNIPVNLSLPDDTSKKLFFQTRLTFPESSNIYVGFETGLFYGYLANSYQVNSANVKKRYSIYYFIKHDGSRGNYMSNATYDCRTRPKLYTTPSRPPHDARTVYYNAPSLPPRYARTVKTFPVAPEIHYSGLLSSKKITCRMTQIYTGFIVLKLYWFSKVIFKYDYYENKLILSKIH